MSSEVALPVYGRTRWRRFGLVAGVVTAFVAVILVLMAKGVLALPVTISGTHFTVAADSLVAHQPDGGGSAFIQFGAVDSDGHSPTGVAVTELPAGGVLSNLNQTVCGPTGLPGGFANLKIVLTADTADATGGLVVDATSLTGTTATFGNMKIGVPVTSDRTGTSTFGQTADSLAINGISQDAVYTQAGTFALSNLHLSASLVGSC